MSVKSSKIVNKGTGAGGANTNANGLPFEHKTDLSNGKDYLFLDERKLKVISKTKFLRNLENPDETIHKIHGMKQPDQAYLDEKSKIVFINEVKFQQCSGSVCEKLQTSETKIFMLSKRYPEYTFHYAYCFNDYLFDKCKGEIQYFDFKGIKYFHGDDSSWKDDCKNWMLSIITEHEIIKSEESSDDLTEQFESTKI